MVSDHSYRVACSLEIVFPFSKGMDHGQEFLVKDVIVSFCSREGFGEEGIGVQVSIKVCLHKNCPSGYLQGNGHDRKGFSGVWESQDRSLGEGCFQCLECDITFCCPVPFCSLFGQVVEGSGNSGEVRDGLSVEVTEPNE